MTDTQILAVVIGCTHVVTVVVLLWAIRSEKRKEVVTLTAPALEPEDTQPISDQITEPELFSVITEGKCGSFLTAWAEWKEGDTVLQRLLIVHYPSMERDQLKQVAQSLFERWKRGEL